MRLTWVRSAHVMHERFLADGDLGGVHVGDDGAQHLRQGDELGLRHGGHLHRGQVT